MVENEKRKMNKLNQEEEDRKEEIKLQNLAIELQLK